MIPLYEINGKQSGKTLLITAGFDGDEYAGIAAAYSLIKRYRKREFAGKLIVIPIVNVAGFEAGTSDNPLDHKFPKNIYPGNPNGSVTERMVYSLEKYTDMSQVWLDMHGGAKDEYLEPYYYLYETGNPETNLFNEKIKKHLKSPKIIHLKRGYWSKPEKLAEKGVNYIIVEAGCLGERKKKYIDYHMRWAEEMMQILGMIDGKPLKKQENIPVFRNIRRISAQKEGIWDPEIPGGKVVKGQILGEILDLRGKTVQIIKSPVKGEYLFGKIAKFCRKNEELMQICY